MVPDTLSYIQKNIIGYNTAIETPYGERHLLYADYTASGRGVHFIEDKLINIQKLYANTHTEDDYTGAYSTTLLHQAEEQIKAIVNAGPEGKIIPIGSGSTGGLKRLHEILGISFSPATREKMKTIVQENCCSDCTLLEKINQNKPVVFIGPYEHHTNEVMWREAFVEIVVIPFGNDGMIDDNYLEKKLQSSEFKNRRKIASFSAGSNVTGLKTDVYKIAAICHRHNTVIAFDFAAVAPYVTIDMNRDPNSYFDAIFFSPHKFLGGPGTCGILIFNEKIYRKDLPPTTAGGGTVDYVGSHCHKFTQNIELRELAGTPPILQTIKTALVMELKEKVGVPKIEKIEANYLKYFMDYIKEIPEIEILGSDIPLNHRLPIISFNIKDRDKMLHPRFVTKLLNDLFGIQSRAGCSCAGPYGHYLLNINDEVSLKYRDVITAGYHGLKPGWVRVNLHYIFTQNDVDFLVKAIKFIAVSGNRFLEDYQFDIKTGDWHHKRSQSPQITLSLDHDLHINSINLSDLKLLREHYISDAEHLAKQLTNPKDQNIKVETEELQALKYFHEVV